jgi:hypothetical protein
VARPALEVADIFRDHGVAWREANRGHVSLAQLKISLQIFSSLAWRPTSLACGFGCCGLR